jgi:hypothetical protein
VVEIPCLLSQSESADRSIPQKLRLQTNLTGPVTEPPLTYAKIPAIGRAFSGSIIFADYQSKLAKTLIDGAEHRLDAWHAADRHGAPIVRR